MGEHFGRALEATTAALRAPVASRLRDIHGGDWEREAGDRLRGREREPGWLSDPHALLSVLLAHPDEFKAELGPETLRHVHEVREVRNAVAHGERISPEQSLRAIGVEWLLNGLSCEPPPAVKQVKGAAAEALAASLKD